MVDFVLNRPSAPDDLRDARHDAILNTYIRAQGAQHELSREDIKPNDQVHIALEALELFATLKIDHAMTQLGRTIAVLLARHPDSIPGALMHLHQFVHNLLAWFGDGVVDMLNTIGDVTADYTRSPNSEYTVDLAFLHSSIFKGLRTSATIRYAGPLAPSNEEAALAARIAALEASIDPREREMVTASVIDRDQLALAFATGSERLIGSEPLDQLRNLRQLSGQSVEKRLYINRVSKTPTSAAWEEVIAALDDRTVMVDLYDGQLPDGLFSTYVTSYSTKQGWRDCRVGRHA